MRRFIEVECYPRRVVRFAMGYAQGTRVENASHALALLDMAHTETLLLAVDSVVGGCPCVSTGALKPSEEFSLDGDVWTLKDGRGFCTEDDVWKEGLAGNVEVAAITLEKEVEGNYGNVVYMDRDLYERVRRDFLEESL